MPREEIRIPISPDWGRSRRGGHCRLPYPRSMEDRPRPCCAGPPLFPTIARRNFNRIPRSVLRGIRLPGADKYSPHGPRRGAAHELKETGSPLAVAASSGVRGSTDFRRYADLSDDVGEGVRNLFPVESDS